MTPEREAYLAVCGKRELQIRVLIRAYKHELKKDKAVCSSYDLKKIGRKPFGYKLSIGNVKHDKIVISALRHELQRIKGMDRVVVPRNRRRWDASITGYLATCECGRDVSWERYCPNCGRKILWEKVK